MFFYDNWSPISLSIKDGTSSITGTTDEIELTAGKSNEVKLAIPQ